MPRHVLVMPFPTQGHLNPALSLAQHLGDAGLHVTIAHTSGNLQALFGRACNNGEEERVPSVIAAGKNVWARALPLKPEQAEKLAPTAPLGLIVPAVEESLPGALQQLIQDINSDTREFNVSYIISDSFLPWTMDVAIKFGIPRAELWTSSATGYLIGSQLADIVEKGYLPIKPGSESTLIDFIPGISGESQLRLGDLPSDLLVFGLSHPVAQFLQRAFTRTREASRVLISSFYQLERNAVEALQAQQLRAIPVGPLLPSKPSPSSSPHSCLPEDGECLQWLDTQAPGSVLYISFGSASSLAEEEIHELALGIEGAQCPFLWALGPGAIGSIGELLPIGYGERTARRGHVVSWAPQLAVLGHAAVGGFLSHCGWNSVMESLSMGIPILGCPRIAEQNTNLWLVSKMLMMGLAMPGLDDEDDGLKRDRVEEGIRALMQGEDGAKARQRAKELKSEARNATGSEGSSSLALQDLIQHIENHM